ncbi:MAG: hypothetical protein Q7S57_00095 [bacterium]|nr:hypothetical protein [bacterium]
MSIENGPNLFNQEEKDPEKIENDSSAEGSYWQMFKDKLSALLAEKKTTSGPSVNISMFFAEHVSAEDIHGLDEQFSSADLFIPEVVDWTPEQLRQFNEVSSGKREPSDIAGDQDGFLGGQLQMIYRSHKPIVFVDLPHGHPLIERYDHLAGQGLPMEKTFSETLQKTRDQIAEFSSINQEREDYILSRVAPAVREVIEKNSVFRDKDQLSVLMLMGAAHSTFYRDVKKAHENTARTFADSFHVFSHYSEGVRRVSLGKEIDDRLAGSIWLGILLERAIDYELAYVTDNSQKKTLLSRKILSEFTLEEIEDVYNGCRTSGKGEYHLIVRNKLKEKNIVIPKTEEEIESYLNSPKNGV